MTCSQPAPSSPISESVGEEHVVEGHFGEVRVARLVDDRPHVHAGQRQIDDELRQALLPVFRRTRRAHQRDHVLAVMRVGRPDLAAGQTPAAFAARWRGCARWRDRSPSPARSCRCRKMPRRHRCAAGRSPSALRCRTENQRTALTVGDPVRGDRRACRQQFLDQHEASERIHACAAVARGQGQADPAACGETPAEVRVEAHPRTGANVGASRAAGCSSRKSFTSARKASASAGKAAQVEGIQQIVHVSLQIFFDVPAVLC